MGPQPELWIGPWKVSLAHPSQYDKLEFFLNTQHHSLRMYALRNLGDFMDVLSNSRFSQLNGSWCQGYMHNSILKIILAHVVYRTLRDNLNLLDVGGEISKS